MSTTRAPTCSSYPRLHPQLHISTRAHIHVTMFHRCSTHITIAQALADCTYNRRHINDQAYQASHRFNKLRAQSLRQQATL